VARLRCSVVVAIGSTHSLLGLVINSKFDS
jgi:hypothetical protein